MAEGYEQYKDDEAASDKLDLLHALAEGWEHQMEEVARCASDLSAAQDRLREIEEKEIPEIMDDVELEELTAKNGCTIKISEIVRCALLAANKPKAFAWLANNGHEALIKRTISMDFGKGENEAAEAFKKQNLAIDPELELTDKSNVHPQTLDKWLREKIEAEEYEDLPEGMFPIFRQRVAKIKQAKK